MADSAFHKRTCFISTIENHPLGDIFGPFNHNVGVGRVIIENCIQLFKAKWRRLKNHNILELTEDLPLFVIAAAILHNICIERNDINPNEASATRTQAQRQEDVENINDMINNAVFDINLNAANEINLHNTKMFNIFTLWSNINNPVMNDPTLQDIQNVYGPEAYII